MKLGLLPWLLLLPLATAFVPVQHRPVVHHLPHRSLAPVRAAPTRDVSAAYFRRLWRRVRGKGNEPATAEEVPTLAGSRRLWRWIRGKRNVPAPAPTEPAEPVKEAAVLAPPPVKVEPVVHNAQVAIIGAGVSGLVCGRALASSGLDVLMVEASDGPGGRVRTDKHEGFLLDRGFQVFIEEYPDVRKELNYSALELSQFWPGALVNTADGSLSLVADPFRRPKDIVKGFVAPIGSIADKAKVGLYRLDSTRKSTNSIFQRPEVTTHEFLQEKLLGGLSNEIIDKFFRPFYQGIFLAPLEQQSSRMFEFVFKMFALGAASLPKQGLGAVSDQLAQSYLSNPTAKLEYNTPATKVETGMVTLANGELIKCDHVIVATEGPTAAKLIGGDAVETPVSRSSTCAYFALNGPPPVTDPLLVLNGRGTSADCPVNNVCFPNAVSASYSPEGQSLASVTIVGYADEPDDVLAAKCRAQLRGWFGDSVEDWRFLKSYKIKHSQPGQTPPNGAAFEKKPEVAERVFCCGDHCATPTLNGAMESGKRVAAAVLSQYTAEGTKLLPSKMATPVKAEAPEKPAQKKADAPQAEATKEAHPEKAAPQAETGADAPNVKDITPKAPLGEAPKAEVRKAEAPKAPVPEAPAGKASKPKAPEKAAPKPEASKGEAPEAPKPEAPKPEAPKPKASKPEASKPEAPKPEAPKPEAPKPEAPKKAAPEAETKADAPKPKVSKPEASKPEAPKPEAPKKAAPEAETKADAPKPKTPKVASAKKVAPKAAAKARPMTDEEVLAEARKNAAADAKKAKK